MTFTIRRSTNIMSLTLQEMVDDPLLVNWLRYIEPKIVRDGDCWMWTSPVQKQPDGTYVAIINLPMWDNIRQGIYRMDRQYVNRFVAEMFWDGIDGTVNVHKICKKTLCINPDHMRILGKGQML